MDDHGFDWTPIGETSALVNLHEAQFGDEQPEVLCISNPPFPALSPSASKKRRKSQNRKITDGVKFATPLAQDPCTKINSPLKAVEGIGQQTAEQLSPDADRLVPPVLSTTENVVNIAANDHSCNLHISQPKTNGCDPTTMIDLAGDEPMQAEESGSSTSNGVLSGLDCINCKRPAIKNREWNGEFCSAQCAVDICRKRFDEFVEYLKSVNRG